MNLHINFNWDDHDVAVRPRGEPRAPLVLAGLVQALSLAFVWGYVADVWQIARTASFTADVPDDWQF